MIPTLAHGFAALSATGLAIGVLLAGADLSANSIVDRIIAEKEGYEYRFLAFQNQYTFLPGDFPQATRIWGAANQNGPQGECADPLFDTGKGTCNGNGNGRIYEDLAGTHLYEVLRAWEHLRLAGLIKTRYSGVNEDLNHISMKPGINIPRSSVNADAGWSVIHSEEVFDATHSFPKSAGHDMVLGGYLEAKYHNGPVLSPQLAQAIDAKIDDGTPGGGRVRAGKFSSPFTPGCSTTDNAETAKYNTDAREILCSLQFKMIF